MAGKPTIKDKLAIFGHEIGRGRFFAKSCGSQKIEGLDKDIDGNWYVLYHNEAGAKCSIRLNNCKLERKQRQEISDNEAYHIATEICGSDKSHNDNASWGRQIVNRMWSFNRHGLFGGHHQEIIDFLRSRGYAIKYGKWSVDELVKFGIFKLI